MLGPMNDESTDRALRAAKRRETWTFSVHALADAPPEPTDITGGRPGLDLASVVRGVGHERAPLMPGRVLRSPHSPAAEVGE